MARLGTYSDRTAAMITGPQLGFLTSLTRDKVTLVAQMNGRPVDTDALDATIAALSTMTKAEASQAIGSTKDDLVTLRQAARYSSQTVEAPVSEAALDTKPLYVVDGKIVRLKVSGAGRTYALTLNTDTRRWDYAPGMVRNVKAEHQMSLEEAKTFGDTYSWCARCGADLTDPVSVAQGMGPVCIKYQR